MANLNDIIQGLIDTDSGIITKLKNTINNVLNKVDEDINDLSEKIARGSGSYGLVDINTPNRGGNGVLETDNRASHGQCISLTTTSSSQCIYSGSFPSSMKYGHYALCARIKIGTVTSSNILQLQILNGSTAIKTVNFSGSEFSTNSQYYYIYTTFIYEGSGSAKTDLSFKLNSLTVSGIKISFDYAYISMVIPSVYL